MTVWWQVFGAMAAVFAVRSLGDDHAAFYGLACSVSVFLMVLAACFPAGREPR